MPCKMGLANLNINQKSSREILVSKWTLSYPHATNRSHIEQHYRLESLSHVRYQDEPESNR
jgi:hypothetical protein